MRRGSCSERQFTATANEFCYHPPVEVANRVVSVRSFFGEIEPGGCPLEVTFECSKCGAIGQGSPLETMAEVSCPRCSHVRPVRSESIDAEGLAKCPLCATEDLYLQKDFPQGMGLAIVILGFVISTIFWYYDRPVPALGILLISALADMALFYLVPDVTICYRCLSQYRGVGSHPSGRFRPFDLAVGERYRQERMRVAEIRAESAKSESPASTDS